MPSLKHDHDSAQRHDRHLHLVPATLDLTGPIPLIDGVPVCPIYGGSRGEPLDFAGLLRRARLPRRRVPRVGVRSSRRDDFNTRCAAPEDAAAVVADWPEDVNIFFGSSPTKGPARR